MWTYAFGGAVNSETFWRSGIDPMEKRTQLGTTAGLGHTFPTKGDCGG
jgi:hypothetical protein